MSRGVKIFASIVYYLIAFVIGILLAIALPYSFFYKGTMKYISTSLGEGNYANAIDVVGGFYNEDYVLHQEFDNGGLVLFETVTIAYQVDEEGKQSTSEQYVHKAYSGYIYGVKDTYDINGSENNKSAIGIVCNGIEDKSTIIEYATDSRTKDTNSSIYQYDFLYMDLGIDEYSKIDKIILYDKNDNVYASIECNLDFGGTFFDDVENFVNVYNEDYTNPELEGLRDEFLNKSDKYHISSYGPVQKKASRKAIFLIVLYFICIYILGDSLLGKKYVIKGFKWLLKKVFHVKFKSDEKISPEEVFGHDYYCNLTLSLDVSEAEDLSTAVLVKYSCSTLDDVEFALIKGDNYTQSKRVKAGTYMNPYTQIADGYYFEEVPEVLKVEGYRMNITLKVKK